MRLLKFFTVLCFIGFYSVGNAQDIFVSAFGGPKWGFHRLSGDNSILKSRPELKPFAGLGGGIVLESGGSAELSLAYNKYSVGFEFKDPFARFSSLAMNTIQIGLRYYHPVYELNDIKFTVNAGVIATIEQSTENDAPWENTVIADGTGDTVVLNSQINYNANSIGVIVEVGGGMLYPYNDNIDFTFNVNVQSGIKDFLRTDLFYEKNGGPTIQSTLQSRGFSVLALIGIRYYLQGR